MEYIVWAGQYIEWAWQGLSMAQQLIIAFGGGIVGIFGTAALLAGRG